MKTLKKARSEFLRYLEATYHPEFIYYPASGADATPKQIFGISKVIHLSLPENEADAKYMERLGRGIKLFGDMGHSPLADKSVDMIFLNLHGIALSLNEVADFHRVLSDGGILAVEDRHVYKEDEWRKMVNKLKTRFEVVEIDNKFIGKIKEHGIRPNKDYGGEQELCEIESVIVGSEDEMKNRVANDSNISGFADEIRYLVMKRIT